jgi:hypothetical protein
VETIFTETQAKDENKFYEYFDEGKINRFVCYKCKRWVNPFDGTEEKGKPGTLEEPRPHGDAVNLCIDCVGAI